MTKTDLKNMTIKEAHDMLKNKKVSAMELLDGVLENIKESNEEVNAYLEIFDDAKEAAKNADAQIAKGEQGALTGIPIAVKDNILIKGKTASASSKMLEPYKAVYDATVISKLKEQKAVFIGRTNMDEFAMGSSTENSAFGATKNPHDITRVPGGSSGGSAAAVAMLGALGALGSDTGGSIRQPAAFCGVVGLKPTYGSVSRHGLMAMASSLDQVGPIAQTVEDVKMIFNAIKGTDNMDSTSHPNPAWEKPDGKKLTIGIPKDFLQSEGIDPDVLENFHAGMEAMKKNGHEIKEISLSELGSALAAYYIIMPAEVSSNLARFDGIRYGLSKEGSSSIDDYAQTRGAGFGKEVRRRILLGTFVLSSGYYDAYYNNANLVRGHIKSALRNAFKDVDIVATPTTPTPAFKAGEKTEDPMSMYLADIFTVPVNLAGVPAISIPSGTVEREGKKLPLGMQFIAPSFGEETLFAAGKDLESALKNA